jgi:hypothetical protein
MVSLPPVRRSVMAGLHAFKGLGRLFPYGGKAAAAPGLQMVYDDGTTVYGGFRIDFDAETVTFVVGPHRDMDLNTPVTDGVWRLRRGS